MPAVATRIQGGVKLRPLGDKVVIRPDLAEERTPGGILLPDQARERPARGVVVAVGPGVRTSRGELIEPQAVQGDIVLYSRYAGTEVEIGGVTLIVMREADLFAAVEPE